MRTLNIMHRALTATVRLRPLGIVVSCALFVVAFLMPGTIQATHLIGGDLRYKCLGNNKYEIRLIYRRDCNLGDPGTEFEDLASIGIFNAANNSPILSVGPMGLIRIPRNPIDTANQYLINDCTLAGADLCIEQTIYIGTVTLPPLADGYKMVYQRCCRNESLNNVFDPLNTGMTLVAILSQEAQQVCNSSPDFGDYPPIFICVDKPLDFTFIANDPDGDSLVFELFTPFLGASDSFPQPSPPPRPPYDTIVWNFPPYNLQNLLGGIPLQIDRFTGVMTGTPNLIGQFLVGVRVYSYRNGMLIETTTREWQFNVRACKEPPTAIIDPSNLLNCEGLTIDFIDATINADEFIWIFDYGGTNPDTSTASNPTYTFPEAGYYDIALLVNDFDSLCFDTAVVTVGVFDSQLQVDFSVDIPKCDMPIIVQAVDGSFDPDFDIVSWEYVLSYPGVQDSSSLQFPLFSIDTAVQGVNLSLTVTASNGCTATMDTTFDANIIIADFKGDTVGVCAGDTVALFNDPGGPFTYTWQPTDGLDLSDSLNPMAFPTVTTTYYVTISDGLCEVEDSVVVSPTPLPELAFVAMTDCRSLVVNIVNASSGGFNYVWEFGDGDMSTDDDPTHEYDDPGVYIITLASDDGCSVNLTDTITVSVITNDLPDHMTNCFSHPFELNPEGSDDYSYLWTPAEFLSSATDPNPTADIDVTTTFYVTITDNANPGCSVVDSVMVVVGEDFDLGAPSDTAYCEKASILLNAGNPVLIYQWFDLDLNLVGEGSELLVAPKDEESYILVGTDALGCEKSDTITLLPLVIQIATGPDVVICFGEDTTISVINLDTAQALIYVWSPANFIDGPNDLPAVTAKPGDNDQLYFVDVTNAIGCTRRDSVWVRVSRFEIEFAPSVLICRGEQIELNVGNFDTSNLSFNWTPVEFIVPGTENTASPTVFPPVTTVFSAHVVNEDYGCATDISVTVNVSWFTPDELVITTDFDTVILGDVSVHVYTNQDPTLDFQWSGPDINNPTAPEITITPTVEGGFTYGVTVTNEDGCELIGEFALIVLDPLCNEETVFLPDAFSPNGDGQNDELRVYSNFLESFDLHIFNRWGEEVYVTKDQNFRWDGSFKGKDLTPDVYGYYMRAVCIPNKQFFKKGNITLFK